MRNVPHAAPHAREPQFLRPGWQTIKDLGEAVLLDICNLDHVGQPTEDTVGYTWR